MTTALGLDPRPDARRTDEPGRGVSDDELTELALAADPDPSPTTRSASGISRATAASLLAAVVHARAGGRRRVSCATGVAGSFPS